MSPKIVDKKLKKQQIAKVALEVIADRGLEGASISRIARAAGIGKGTVYEYFDSKEQLFLFAVKLWSEELMSGLSEPGAAGEDSSGHSSASEALRRFGVESIQRLTQDERVLKISRMLLQLWINDAGALKEHNPLTAVYHVAGLNIKMIIAAGVEGGEFGAGSLERAEAIAFNMLAFLDGIAGQCLMNQAPFDLNEQVDLYFDALFCLMKTL